MLCTFPSVISNFLLSSSIFMLLVDTVLLVHLVKWSPIEEVRCAAFIFNEGEEKENPKFNFFIFRRIKVEGIKVRGEV